MIANHSIPISSKTQENQLQLIRLDLVSLETMILKTLCNFQGAGRPDAGLPRAGALGTGCCELHPREPDGRRVIICVFSLEAYLPRKEVIQPHLPVRLPCYDFTPLTLHTFDASPPQRVGPAASGADDSGGVTGGVYKARERIHRAVLMRDY